MLPPTKRLNAKAELFHVLHAPWMVSDAAIPTPHFDARLALHAFTAQPGPLSADTLMRPMFVIPVYKHANLSRGRLERPLIVSSLRS